MNIHTESLLSEIEQYWTRRAESYSELINYEMMHENEERWMKVIMEHLPDDRDLHILDIGTGPGFFAIGMAKRGYQVTAVDYTQAMLDKAVENAGEYRDKIDFYRMDAHNLDFMEASFEVILTRNLTWNLEKPQVAYCDWYRVLKKGGVLLNFDAGWYAYLYDERKCKEYLHDRRHIAELGIKDFNDYSESAVMENISRNLILSRQQRPGTDIKMLNDAGFSSVTVDTGIGERVWDETEKINYVSTPMFLLKAIK